MSKKFLTTLILGVWFLPGCSLIPDVPATVNGSGNVISETRAASGFTSISLESSADVNVTFGTAESVVITAEDNIAPLIETNVQNHQLIIKTRPLATFSTTKPVRINLTMKSLERVSMSGSGNINVPEVTGDAISVDMPGSGNITIGGTANSVNINMDGSGNIFCDKLITKSATVVLKGSGNITVYASDSLDATNSGSGDIRYSGSPASVSKKVTSSGSIHE